MTPMVASAVTAGQATFESDAFDDLAPVPFREVPPSESDLDAPLLAEAAPSALVEESLVEESLDDESLPGESFADESLPAPALTGLLRLSVR